MLFQTSGVGDSFDGLIEGGHGFSGFSRGEISVAKTDWQLRVIGSKGRRLYQLGKGVGNFLCCSRSRPREAWAKSSSGLTSIAFESGAASLNFSCWTKVTPR